MSLIEYGNLLYEVGEKIDWTTEGRRLLFICRAFLPDGCELNNIQDALSLLIKLEEEDKLGIDSLDVLKDLLEKMGKWDLLQTAEKIENKRKGYKRLLEQGVRVLDGCSQLEQLISVCKGKIPSDRQEHITDVQTLFTELEKQKNLGIKRLEILKTMAVKMEKPDLVEQVEEFKKKIKQEENAERRQNEFEEARRGLQVQTAAVLASAVCAGRRLIGIVTPHCTFRNFSGGIVVVTACMILRKSSSLQEFVNAFTKTVLPLGNILLAMSEGSLCFTVQAQTTLALGALWKTYQDGTLQRKLQDFLITEEIKELVGSEVKLTVKIDVQEYKNASWDLILTETQEIKEEREGSEDQSSSEFAHAEVKEAHPQAEDEVSQKTDVNLLDRIAFVKEYLENLQETNSITQETTDSGLWSQCAPSEPELYKGTEDFQELPKQVDEWIKGISKKLDILAETEGEATRDEDQLDNIQQVRKEMENIRKILDRLEKPEGETKYGEDFQGVLKPVHEWMKMIRKTLTEPGGDILNNLQQAKKEMENFREMLEGLEKPVGKTKYGGYVVSDMETLRDNTGQLMLFYVQRCLDPPETLTRKTWRSVGLALNVNAGDLDLIEADYKAGRSPTESLLNLWKTFENEPKLTEFVQALILCERHDVAQYINNCPWS